MCEKEVRSGQEDVLADGPSRRDFLTTSGGIGAGMLVGGLTGNVQAQEPERGPQPGTGRRILLKGGVVLTMDPELGDLEQADVLIDGARIAEVSPNIQAEADVIDAAGMIVMPGFIDTHHHQYETIQRSILADGILRGAGPRRPISRSSRRCGPRARTPCSISAARPMTPRTTTSRSWLPRSARSPPASPPASTPRKARTRPSTPMR
jgi:TAT (twin-arginine translocation) pathway signal sequence